MKLSVLLSAFCLLGWVMQAQAQSTPIVIKFSHVTAAESPKGKAADFFAHKAAALTQGRVRVEVYPNSQLYKDREEMEALQLGFVQMLAPSLSKFGQLGVKEFELFDLPYLFDGYETLRKLTLGPVGAMLLDKLAAKGVKGLAYWDNGFKSFSTNSPIRRPADLKGKRLRIQPSGVIEEQMRALGAKPYAMAFSAAYKALEAGMVDGAENPPSNFYGQKMHEVQKHFTLTEHGYLGYAVIANRKFWDGLPPDIRQALAEAMEQSTRYANQIARIENETALEQMKNTGKVLVYKPTPAERSAFKKALAPVHARAMGGMDGELMRRVYRDIGYDPDRR